MKMEKLVEKRSGERKKFIFHRLVTMIIPRKFHFTFTLFLRNSVMDQRDILLWSKKKDRMTDFDFDIGCEATNKDTSFCHLLLLKKVRSFYTSSYSTESSRNLVVGRLHDADQRGDEAHLHGTLAAFDLCQFLKDVLSQGRHHRV